MYFGCCGCLLWLLGCLLWLLLSAFALYAPSIPMCCCAAQLISPCNLAFCNIVAVLQPSALAHRSPYKYSSTRAVIQYSALHSTPTTTTLGACVYRTATRPHTCGGACLRHLCAADARTTFGVEASTCPQPDSGAPICGSPACSGGSGERTVSAEPTYCGCTTRLKGRPLHHLTGAPSLDP